MPLAFTVMLLVVAPLLHRYDPVETDDVKVTLPPWQKVVTPLAVTVGVAEIGLTNTAITFEGKLAQVPVF